LMISGMLLKRPAALAEKRKYEGLLSAEGAIIDEAKTIFGVLAESAKSRAEVEQEILMLLADIAIEIYAMDTAYHRTRKTIGSGRNGEICIAMFRTFVNDAISRIQFCAKQAAVATGGDVEPV